MISSSVASVTGGVTEGIDCRRDASLPRGRGRRMRRGWLLLALALLLVAAGGGGGSGGGSLVRAEKKVGDLTTWARAERCDKKLGMDEARLRMSVLMDAGVDDDDAAAPLVPSLYVVSDECYKCLPVLLVSNMSGCAVVNTWHGWHLRLQYEGYTDDDDNGGKDVSKLDLVSHVFDEHGHYNVTAVFKGSNDDDLGQNWKLRVHTVKNGISQLRPFVLVWGSALLIGLVIWGAYKIFRIYHYGRHEGKNQPLHEPFLTGEAGFMPADVMRAHNGGGEPELGGGGAGGPEAASDHVLTTSSNGVHYRSSGGSGGNGAGGVAESGANSEADAVKKGLSTKERLKSLDTFRGISLMIMIFVNYGGGGFSFFDHSTWNGLTVADLVFPWFIWMMGVSMAISFNSLFKKGISRFVLVQKVLRRSAILLGLGLFLNNGYNPETWRFFGVLQYFAVSYLIVGLTIVACYSDTVAKQQELQRQRDRQGHHRGGGPTDNPDVANNMNDLNFDEDPLQTSSGRGHGGGAGAGGGAGTGLGGDVRRKGAAGLLIDDTFESEEQEARQHRQEQAEDAPRYEAAPWCYIRDLAPYWREWILLALPMLWLILTFAIKVPGCPLGYIGAGGLANDAKHITCTGGSHRYIDVQLFGAAHIYHEPTCTDFYSCKAYDPEGTVGMLNAAFLTYLGVIAGRVVIHYKTPQSRLRRWAIWALALLTLGGALCGFSKNQGAIPSNKNLWSLSFILITGGGGFVMLSLTYLLVDVFKVWEGGPCRFLGLNSIVIYTGSGIFDGYFPFHYNADDNHTAQLLCNTIGTACWAGIAYVLYRNKTFIKI